MKPNDVEEGSGGGPASVPSSTAKYPKTTLQEQARELIDEILADTARPGPNETGSSWRNAFPGTPTGPKQRCWST